MLSNSPRSVCPFSLGTRGPCLSPRRCLGVVPPCGYQGTDLNAEIRLCASTSPPCQSWCPSLPSGAGNHSERTLLDHPLPPLNRRSLVADARESRCSRGYIRNDPQVYWHETATMLSSVSVFRRFPSPGLEVDVAGGCGLRCPMASGALCAGLLCGLGSSRRGDWFPRTRGLRQDRRQVEIVMPFITLPWKSCKVTSAPFVCRGRGKVLLGSRGRGRDSLPDGHTGTLPLACGRGFHLWGQRCFPPSFSCNLQEIYLPFPSPHTPLG